MVYAKITKLCTDNAETSTFMVSLSGLNKNIGIHTIRNQAYSSCLSVFNKIIGIHTIRNNSWCEANMSHSVYIYSNNNRYHFRIGVEQNKWLNILCEYRICLKDPGEASAVWGRNPRQHCGCFLPCCTSGRSLAHCTRSVQTHCLAYPRCT